MRVIQVDRDILEKKDTYAAANRARLAAAGMAAVNSMSSPPSAKTMLVRTFTELGSRYPIAVIEGDPQTSMARVHLIETSAGICSGRGRVRGRRQRRWDGDDTRTRRRRADEPPA